MGKNLLIVESPAKAKTIAKYLGADFIVKSSVGHIRDLPPRDFGVKIAAVGENKWKFLPVYEISEDKEKVVKDLRSAVKNADAIYLASDPDREGEAIAWHLYEVLSPVADSKPFYRVAYNQITKDAVCTAVAHPRKIDMTMVDAQQSRRIIDRFVGFEVSPLLWKSVSVPNPKTLAAGRVQSVALRLLVERQREIDAFVPELYFLLGVEAQKKTGTASFVAKLSKLDDNKPEIHDRQVANNILLDVSDAELEVTNLKEQSKARHALPPFTTSTMQQAASSVYGIPPEKSMKLAQGLYEQGLITYMRTDSVDISEVAKEAAHEFIVKNYGPEYSPEKANSFKSKAGAQEAHEAIRPTDVNLKPEGSSLDGPELKLYDLIWRRFLASQMSDAKTTLRTAYLVPRKDVMTHSYIFTASATSIDFEGFLKVMKLSSKKKKSDDEESEDSDEIDSLPPLQIGERLNVVRWIADEKQTKGPSYYSEASLIKALEENGVGRPSTYAATINVLKKRFYAKAEKKKFIPQERGILVWEWLEKKLEPLFNVKFTSEMEANLDKIADEGESMDKFLSEFYAKFKKDLEASVDPPPDKRKFVLLFNLLDQVKVWKKPVTIGRKKYDDKAFVESVKEQMNADKPLSAKQFDFLVRMVTMYASQIPDAEKQMKEYGIGAGASLVAQKADEELVNYCFGVMDRIGGMLKNPFLKSLRDQVERGRGLSMKQFAILARSVGENASSLEDCTEIREKLKEFVPNGFTEEVSNPVIPKILNLMKTVTEWREALKRGKKLYDDKSFVESLAEQYDRRHSLTRRQELALRRVAVAYKDKIPDYDKYASELGLTDIPSSSEKTAEVFNDDKTP